MNQTTLHIEFEKITDFVQGKIAENEKTKVAAHLGACPICAMQKKRLEQTLSVMISDKTETVPTYLSERVFDMFDLLSAPAKTEKSSMRERIIAALQFDKLVPAHGLRSTEIAEIRNIHFIVKDYLITLQITPTSASDWRIDGEIFGEGSIGSNVLIESEIEKRTAEIDDFSQFNFDGVKTGKYNLSISLENYEISIPEFVVEY